MADLDQLLNSLKQTGEATIIDSIDPIGNLFNYFVVLKYILIDFAAKTTLIPFIIDYTNPEIYNKLEITLEDATQIQQINNQLIILHKLTLQYYIQEYVIASITKQLYDDIINEIPEGNMDYLIQFIQNYEEEMQKMQKGGAPFGKLLQIITAAFALVTNITTKADITTIDDATALISQSTFDVKTEPEEVYSQGLIASVNPTLSGPPPSKYALTRAITSRSKMYEEGWYGRFIKFAASTGLVASQAQNEIKKGVKMLNQLYHETGVNATASCNKLAGDLFYTEYFKKGYFDRLYDTFEGKYFEEPSSKIQKGTTPVLQTSPKKTILDMSNHFKNICINSYSGEFRVEGDQLIMENSLLSYEVVMNMWDTISDQLKTLQTQATGNQESIYESLKERATQHAIIMRQINAIYTIPQFTLGQRGEQVIPNLINNFAQQLGEYQQETIISSKKLPISDRNTQLTEIISQVQKELAKRQGEINFDTSIVGRFMSRFSGGLEAAGASSGELAAAPFVGFSTGFLNEVLGEGGYNINVGVLGGLMFVVFMAGRFSTNPGYYRKVGIEAGYMIASILPAGVVQYYIASPQASVITGAVSFILIQMIRKTPQGNIEDKSRLIAIQNSDGQQVPMIETSAPYRQQVPMIQAPPPSTADGVLARAERLSTQPESDARREEAIRIRQEALSIQNAAQEIIDSGNGLNDGSLETIIRKCDEAIGIVDRIIGPTGGRRRKTRKNKRFRTRKLKRGKRRYTRHRRARPTRRR